MASFKRMGCQAGSSGEKPVSNERMSATVSLLLMRASWQDSLVASSPYLFPTV